MRDILLPEEHEVVFAPDLLLTRRDLERIRLEMGQMKRALERMRSYLELITFALEQIGLYLE